MAITATRLTSTGTLLVNGQIDEFAAGGSLSFNGTSYLTGPAAVLIPATQSTFTVESWIYMTSNPVSFGGAYVAPLVGGMQAVGGGGSVNDWSFGPVLVGANINVGFYWYPGVQTYVYGTTTNMSLNTWYHIAISVNANAISLYVNGILQTLTGTTTLTNRTNTYYGFALGVYNGGSSTYTGYATNVRVVNGVAVYPSNFTPPTAPLTAISGTQLLIDVLSSPGYITDTSTNNYTLTNSSVVFVSPNPFTSRLGEVSGISVTGDTQYAGSFDETSAPLVANGLIAYIDAGRGSYLPTSSSGTNTTFIRDLTGGQQADAVINGTVQWVSNGAGNIASYWWWPSSATGNYISSTVAQNYLDFTIVFQPDFTLTTTFGLVGLIAASNDTTSADKSVRFSSANGTGPWATANPGDLNDWANPTATTYYVNGIARTSSSNLSTGWNILGGTRTNTTNGAFASPFSYFLGTEGYSGDLRGFRGNIAAVAFYNRSLSAAEQLQNYTYFASRYIGAKPAARIDTSQGNVFVTGSFDEFTGAPYIDANLVAWLDAGQLSSYSSGSGTTWTNLISTNSNWTLTNGPTYESTLGGMFNFVGASSQYAVNNTSLYNTTTYPYFSVMMWVRPTGAGQLLSMLGQTAINSLYHFSLIEISAANVISFLMWNGAETLITTYSATLNTWYHLAITYNGSVATAYVNGIAVGSPLTITWTAPGGLYYGLMATDSTNGGTTGYGNGRIQAFMAYNSGLSADQIQQNYNALKRRYGLA